MKPNELLELSRQSGVRLSIDSSGGIRVRGKVSQTKRLAPLIRENKAGLLELLRPNPPFVLPRISNSSQRKMSPRAAQWLSEHEEKLLERGWSLGELYRTDKVKGIGWSRLWLKDNLSVILEDSGRVVWTFSDTSGHIISQNSWPPYYLPPGQDFKLF
jgi:hypothetical protein